MLPYPIGIREKSFIRYGVGDWEAITCPEWVKFLRVNMYGVGGNGGSGFSGIAGSGRGGGGSGANGNTSGIIIPLYGFVNRTFYLFLGGSGSGAISYLSLQPESTQAWLILQCNAGPNGGNSSGSSGGSAAIAASANSAINGMMSNIGIPHFRTSKVGIAGSNTGNGSPGVWGSGHLTNPGGGGGGVSSTNRTGGGQTGLGFTPTLVATPSGSNNGADGIFSLDGPFPYSLGGSGGGSNNSGVGGNGGNGAPGSGGGGGGGGTTGGTGGTGGCAFAHIMMG